MRKHGKKVSDPASSYINPKKSIATLMFFLANILAPLASATPLPSDLLVSANWLSERLSDPNLVIIDARSPQDFTLQHVAGASNIPDNATFRHRDGYALISPISVMRDTFTRAGINDQRYVVVYDGGEYVQATRLFWVLEVYGHRSVYILNGGFPRWIEQNYPTDQKTNSPQDGFFVPSIAGQYLASKIDTRLAIDSPQYAIIDSRDASEYSGLQTKNGKYGHIPSAINIPWHRHFDQHDGQIAFRPLRELQALYRPALDRKIIAYCTYGNESTITYFTLRRLGRPVAVYDGSWAEWSSDQSMPQISFAVQSSPP